MFLDICELVLVRLYVDLFGFRNGFSCKKACTIVVGILIVVVFVDIDMNNLFLRWWK